MNRLRASNTLSSLRIIPAMRRQKIAKMAKARQTTRGNNHVVNPMRPFNIKPITRRAQIMPSALKTLLNNITPFLFENSEGIKTRTLQ